MKIINMGMSYHVYADDIKTFDCLPPKVYKVTFSPMGGGFGMEETDPIHVTEKVYGVHEKKVEKVMSSFEKMERNMGIILSGAKGIGKSLFAKMLAENAVINNLPVIIIDTYIPGIADFINSIQQPIMVMFDEFDKTFAVRGKDNEHGDPQAEMLTLFDGFSTGKKLFVITCNELRNLNEFLVNRPGRFHYHFRFEYPDGDEIRTYLNDNGVFDEKEIKAVIDFSGKVALNYDCLRSIAFELNLGETFAEAIKDLNIINFDNYATYNMIAYFDNGAKCKDSIRVDMFSNEERTVNIEDEKNYDRTVGHITFSPSDLDFNSLTQEYTLAAEDASFNMVPSLMSIHEDEDDDDYNKAWYARFHGANLEKVVFKRPPEKAYHYAI